MGRNPVCGFFYAPADHGGVALGDLPDDRKCERCRPPKKSDFRMG